MAKLTDAELDMLIRKAGVSGDPAAEGTMVIEVARIRGLQFGYEQRIGRQRDAIDRLMLRIEQLERSELEHKQRANEAARLAADAADALPVATMAAAVTDGIVADIADDRDKLSSKIVMLGYEIGQRFPWKGLPDGDIERVWHVINHMTSEIDRLGEWFMANVPDQITGGGAVDIAIRLLGESLALRQMAIEIHDLVPEDWDLYNEDDTPETILVGFVKWLQTEAEHQKRKQVVLGRQLVAIERQRDELEAEAVNMRKIVQGINTVAQPTVTGDDTPPWIGQSTVSRSTPLPTDDPALPGGADHEVLAFDLSGTVPNETRPGGF